MPLLGEYGASVWDQLIKSQPIEFILREAAVTIEAGTTRKPNKAREVANLEQIVPSLLPVLQGYAQATTNTEPLNELIDRMFNSLEMDGSGLKMGPLQPPPPPPEQQQQMQQEQQQGQQQEVDRMQAERASEQMQMQAAQMEHQFKMQIMGKEVEQKQMELQFDQQAAQLDMNVEMMKAQLAERELRNQFSRMQAEEQMQQRQPPQ